MADQERKMSQTHPTLVAIALGPNADLDNSNNPPAEIVGIASTGGTLTAN